MVRVNVILDHIRECCEDIFDHPEIPWKRIAGMRDLAAHKYQTLDMVAVWNVVQDRIPELYEFTKR